MPEKLENKACIINVHYWLIFQKLVCKVDQLVKRRAKSGLIRVNVDWSDAKEFINQHLGKEIKVRLVSFYWGFQESKELITYT